MEQKRRMNEKKQHAKPVSLIYGSDEFMVCAKARNAVNELIATEQQPLGLVTIDGAAKSSAEATAILQRVLDEIQTIGFLGRKVVWLRDALFLGTDPVSKSASVLERLAALTSALSAGLPSNHTLVITAPSVDARSRFFNFCRKTGDVLMFEIEKSSWKRDRNALQHVSSAFRKRELHADNRVLEAFLERVGSDSRLIEQEAEKLSVFIGEPRNVQQDDIEAIVSFSAEADVWDLQDSLGNRNAAESLAIIRRLLFQGQTPVRLISCIENRFRLLSVFREALDKGWLVASRENGNRVSAPVMGRIPREIEPLIKDALLTSKGKMHPYLQGKLAAQAAKFTGGDLNRLCQMIMQTHTLLVSSSAPSEALLELLVIKICDKREKNHIHPANEKEIF